MDSEWDRIILILAAPFVAVVALPIVLPRVREWVVEKLLAYEVVVPASDAIVQIPSTGIGLDMARIVIGVGVVVIAASVVWGAVKRSGQER
jgi:hypothetical protein